MDVMTKVTVFRVIFQNSTNYYGTGNFYLYYTTFAAWVSFFNSASARHLTHNLVVTRHVTIINV